MHNIVPLWIFVQYFIQCAAAGIPISIYEYWKMDWYVVFFEIWHWAMEFN